MGRTASKQAALNAKDTVEKQKLVLFDGADGLRMAIPLERAGAGWKSLRESDVERSGNEWVVQYRGQILPLIRLSHVLEDRRDGGIGREAHSLSTARIDRCARYPGKRPVVRADRERDHRYRRRRDTRYEFQPQEQAFFTRR